MQGVTKVSSKLIDDRIYIRFQDTTFDELEVFLTKGKAQDLLHDLETILHKHGGSKVERLAES